MPHTDIRSRLRPEEIERLEEIQRKYPEIDFAVQRCTQYRASNIRRYMELSRWDPEVQRLLALSGYRWKDVHLVIAAISRSRGDYKRRRLKELNEWVPPCLTDELKPLAERVDPDGDPESLAAELAKAQNAREIAEIKLEAANRLADSEMKRADREAKRADEAFEFIQQMQEQMSQSNEQWRESVGQFLAAHTSGAKASNNKAKADDVQEFGQVENLTREEIDAKLRKREEGQADRAAEEEALRKAEACRVLNPVMPNAEKCARMLDDIGAHTSFKNAFNYVMRPYADAGDLDLDGMQQKLGYMAVAEQLNKFLRLSNPVPVGTIANYLGKAVVAYQRGEVFKY